MESSTTSQLPVARESGSRKNGLSFSKWVYKAAEAALSFAFLIVIWEAIVWGFSIQPYIVPAPSSVFSVLARGIASGAFNEAILTTFTEVIVGFVFGSLLGIGVGTALVSFPPLFRIVYPYIVAIQTIPKVAIAPLFIVWFGFGIESKIIIVLLSCTFPVLVNTIAGLRSTEADRIALVMSLCGSRWQLLRYVQFPSALPYIFAGLNTGVVLAVIGAIVGEFVGSRQGIGVTILQANFSLDLATVFAMLIILSIGGVLLSAVVRFLENRIVFWSGKSVK